MNQNIIIYTIQFSHSVVSYSLWPHGLQHARLSCPSPIPGACSNSCPSSWWCHPTVSCSVVPFSSCLQSFPASGSFQMSQFFTSGGLTPLLKLHRNPDFHVRTEEEPWSSCLNLRWGPCQLHQVERYPERPLTTRKDSWLPKDNMRGSLRSLWQLEETHTYCRNSRNTLRFPLPCELRPDSPAMTPEHSRARPCNLNGDLTSLRQHERLPEFPGSDSRGIPTGPLQLEKRPDFSEAIKYEPVPEIPVATREEPHGNPHPSHDPPTTLQSTLPPISHHPPFHPPTSSHHPPFHSPIHLPTTLLPSSHHPPNHFPIHPPIHPLTSSHSSSHLPSHHPSTILPAPSHHPPTTLPFTPHPPSHHPLTNPPISPPIHPHSHHPSHLLCFPPFLSFLPYSIYWGSVGCSRPWWCNNEHGTVTLFPERCR